MSVTNRLTIQHQGSADWNFQSLLSARITDNQQIPIKGKSIPLQAWSGPEGSRKLRFPDFMTSAQEGGKVVILRHRPYLPSGNSHRTHFC